VPGSLKNARGRAPTLHIRCEPVKERCRRRTPIRENQIRKHACRRTAHSKGGSCEQRWKYAPEFQSNR